MLFGEVEDDREDVTTVVIPEGGECVRPSSAVLQDIVASVDASPVQVIRHCAGVVPFNGVSLAALSSSPARRGVVNTNSCSTSEGMVFDILKIAYHLRSVSL
jgi:hypothetical protein